MTGRLACIVVVGAVAWSAGIPQAVAQPPGSLAPRGWDAQAKLVEAIDRNPDPHVVEIDLTAQLAEVEVEPGKRVRAWTYNGLLPGPLIRTRVGDRLIVHFKNELEEPTTVHWHGIRVPIEMDGVPDISQPPVRRGESFTYDFVVRDAGLYWYHPHVMAAAQVGFGLYGALLVDDPDDGVGIADDITLVLSDMGVDSRGVLEAADSGGSAGMVFGREGNVVLVNGKRRPTLRARAGAPQRWRIVNTAKSRFFSLYMGGQPFTIIGRDGGLQERATTDTSVVVATGERVDVIVMPTGKPGGTLTVESQLFNRGYGSVEYRTPEDLFTIQFTGERPLPKPTLPDVRRQITPPSAAGATIVPLTFTLPPLVELGHSEFQINGVPFWEAAPYSAALGETQLWVLKNDTVYDHPFHLHGFFFVVVDEKGEPRRPLAWRDTINVPQKATERILVRFDERPGEWMFHCHILDHAEGGLMGTVQVGPRAPEAAGHVHTSPAKP